MGRTKGSKNGISNTPGYVAIGEKAKGILNNAGQYMYNQVAPAANTLKNKLKTKDLNPAMPGATAKYLDKKNEAKQKAIEKMTPKVQPYAQAPMHHGYKEKADDYANKMQQLSAGLRNAEDYEKAKDYDSKMQDMRSTLSNIALKIPNQNGNSSNNSNSEIKKEEKQNSNKKSNGGGWGKFISQVADIAADKNKRQELTKTLRKAAAAAEESIGTGVARGSYGQNEVKKEVKGAVKGALDKIPDKSEKKAKNENAFTEFVKNDIHDRASSVRDKVVAKGKAKVTDIVNKSLDDKRIQGDLSDLAEAYYKGGTAGAMKTAAGKAMDPEAVRRMSKVGLDAAVKTYEGSKAKNDDRFTDFIKNDIQDRLNERKKQAKDKAANKAASTVAKVTKDPRLQKEIQMMKQDPEAAVKKIANDIKNDPKAAKKYKEVAADIAIPTYEGSKASNDDNFFDFVLNDIQDRHNDTKKKVKKKIVG